MVLQKDSRKVSKEAVAIGLMAVFVIINLSGLAKYLGTGIEFISTPFMFSSSRAADSLALTLDSFTQISKLRNENNSLQIELAKTKAENDNVTSLIGENLALKKELNLRDDKGSLLEAEVLSSFGKADSSTLLLNKGANDGVSKDDIVRIGDIYIGSVSSVSEKSCVILLPTNKRSVLSALIEKTNFSDKSLRQIKAEVSSQKEILGVVVGDGGSILVEDISNNAEFSEGYSVIINDEKVGQYMYLGRISKIIEDPSAVEKQARVEPGVDYKELKYVYIVVD